MERPEFVHAVLEFLRWPAAKALAETNRWIGETIGPIVKIASIHQRSGCKCAVCGKPVEHIHKGRCVLCNNTLSCPECEFVTEDGVLTEDTTGRWIPIAFHWSPNLQRPLQYGDIVCLQCGVGQGCTPHQVRKYQIFCHGSDLIDRTCSTGHYNIKRQMLQRCIRQWQLLIRQRCVHLVQRCMHTNASQHNITHMR